MRGHRRYGSGDLEWLVLIKQLRSTGMSVREMQHFAELVRHQRVLQAQLGDIGETLRLLEHKTMTYRRLETTRELHESKEAE